MLECLHHYRRYLEGRRLGSTEKAWISVPVFGDQRSDDAKATRNL